MKITYMVSFVFFLCITFFGSVFLYSVGVNISPIIILCVVITGICVLGIVYLSQETSNKQQVTTVMHAIQEMYSFWKSIYPTETLTLEDGRWYKKKDAGDGKTYVGVKFTRSSTNRSLIMIYCLEDKDVINGDISPSPDKISNVFHGFNPSTAKRDWYSQTPWAGYPHNSHYYRGGYGYPPVPPSNYTGNQNEPSGGNPPVQKDKTVIK